MRTKGSVFANILMVTAGGRRYCQAFRAHLLPDQPRAVADQLCLFNRGSTGWRFGRGQNRQPLRHDALGRCLFCRNGVRVEPAGSWR